MPWDVMTLGESMLRLSPPGDQRIEQARACDLYVGGAESNTAVGLAQLGLSVSHLCRLPRNALGRRIVGELQKWGVGTAHTMWSENGRVGVYWLETGEPPRGSRVIYDRANSVASQMTPDHLPDVFTSDSSRLLHTTGITAAISETARQTVLSAVQRAKAADWLVSFDLNYRANLWTYSQAFAACAPIFQQVDVLFAPLRDAIPLFSLDESVSAEEAARFISATYPQCHVVLTMGAQGALCCTKDGDVFTQQAAPTTASVGRVGAGDAFAAGLLYSFLQGDDWHTCLAWGNACATFKFTIPGDLPLISKAEIAAFLQDDRKGGSIQR